MIRVGGKQSLTVTGKRHVHDYSRLGQAIALGQQATRQYAKRQYTWFAHQPPPEWPRFTNPAEGDNIAAALELLRPSA